jgi:hypothetical protein
MANNQFKVKGYVNIIASISKASLYFFIASSDSFIGNLENNSIGKTLYAKFENHTD